jgi:hypothetical protein
VTPRRNYCGDDLFREVNDRIIELSERFAVEGEPLELICECEDSACTDRVEISAADLFQLRNLDGLHLIATGHLRPGRVVRRGKRYLVVADD